MKIEPLTLMADEHNYGLRKGDQVYPYIGQNQNKQPNGTWKGYFVIIPNTPNSRTVTQMYGKTQNMFLNLGDVDVNKYKKDWIPTSIEIGTIIQNKASGDLLQVVETQFDYVSTWKTYAMFLNPIRNRIEVKDMDKYTILGT